jgi:OOP family OmpA-OmpF porin
MKYRNKLTVAAAAVLAVAPLTATADGHFYLGGSIGSASLSEDFDGFDVDADSTAYRLVAGWQFSDYFSLEGGYHNFGTFEQGFDVGGEPVDVSLKADGFVLGATGTVPLSEKFALYGRAGFFFWDGDAEINDVSQARPEDTNLYIGAGIKFALSDRLSLLGDWTRYELEDTRSDVASLGLTLSF